jgi:hypothetical protein
LLLLVIAVGGCASSSSLRNFPWWRNKTAQNAVTQDKIAQSVTGEARTADAISSVPAKLPPGIELPPETRPASQTLPSAATEENTNSVIFAGANINPTAVQ